MAVVTGFRDVTVGTDTVMYYNIYSWMRLYNSKYCPMEIGYCTLNKQMAAIGSSFSNLLLLEGICLYFGLFYFTWKLVDCSLWTSVPLLFYATQAFFNGLNTSRQYFAMGFVLIAVTLLHEKKNILAVVFLVAGVCIHYSSAVVIVVFIVLIAIKKRMFSILAVCAYIVSLGVRIVGPDKLFQTIIAIVPKYNHYTGSAEFATLGSFQFVFFTVVLPNILFILCYLINYFNEMNSLVGNKYEYKDSLFLSGALLYVCAENAFTGSMALARFADVFVALYIAYLCNTLSRIIDKRVMVFLWIAIILVLTISCYYFIGIRGYQAVIPFEFWKND